MQRSLSIKVAGVLFAVASLHIALSARQASPLRSEVRVDRGVVAAGRTFSAEAGARLLSAGGNAVDAGVAGIFAAAVVEISHFGLGGEAPIIIYSAKNNRVVVFNGQKTVDVQDSKHAGGPFALQYAAGVIKFRKVQIKPL